MGSTSNLRWLAQKEESTKTLRSDKCDIYDYLIATCCGVIAGITDVFLVGSPKDSKLQRWTDARVNKVVMMFAKMLGWSPKEGKENNVASAIGFLERKFRVNYDQRNTNDVGGLFDISSKNHHMKSLAHSPDIIGLFFSILNQFTSTASFLHEGKLITIKTDTFELQGNNIVSKIFCGTVNWIGHIMSDVAGSSGSVGRGNGIVIPFYGLIQLFDFGSFRVGNYRNTLAKLATKAFQEGYDFRFGLTMAIPVVLCDLLIRFLWAIKRYFYHKRPISECIPTEKHDTLRVMLIIGEGTLCLFDAADAIIRSRGDALLTLLRLNTVAWFRLALLVFKEVCIRSGIGTTLQKQLNAYIRINKALGDYLAKLEQIDIERFKEETEQYNKVISMLEKAKTEDELNVLLKEELKRIEIQLPYGGDFDDFMRDSNSRLEFK